MTNYGEQWINERPGLAPKTRALYGGLVRLHIQPKLGDVSLADLTPGGVRTWRKELLDGGTGPVTVAKAYRLLKAVLKHGRRRRVDPPEPVPDQGRRHRAQSRAADRDDRAGLRHRRCRRPWFKALVLLAAFTGLRWGELIALRRRHL